MDINSMTPNSGRILAEDGTVVNVIDLFSAYGIAPISNEVHDIESYSPRSLRVLGEDGRVYDGLELLRAIAAGGGGGGTTNHALLSNLDFNSSGHTGFASRVEFNAMIGWINGMQVQPLPATLTALGNIGQLQSYPFANFAGLASDGVSVAPLKTIFFDTVGNLVVYIGDWSNPRPLQWHIDNATDLIMRRVTVVSAGGTSDHSALTNLEFENSGHTGFASQSALEAEAQARHEEITTAIDEEASVRQGEIEDLNLKLRKPTVYYRAKLPKLSPISHSARK